jgi:hypothetical protein
LNKTIHYSPHSSLFPRCATYSRRYTRRSLFGKNIQEDTMSKELLFVKEEITLAAGSGGVDQSFQNIPGNKFALIELFSFRLKEQSNIEDMPDPIELWAYPGGSGPPRTKTVFFPIEKSLPGSRFSAGTYAIKFRLEPGDSWGVSLYRQNHGGTSELEVFLSGYFYPAA